MGKKEILKKITAQQDIIKNFGVDEIGLFGSYAKNKATRKSDVDILVKFGRKSFDNYMDLKFFLEKLLKNNVDLVIHDALRPELKPQILKDVIYVPGI